MKKSLRYELSRGLFQSRDVSNTMVADIAAAILAHFGETLNPTARPEVEAASFYLNQHGLSVVQKRFSPSENLGDCYPLVREIQKDTIEAVRRMFSYLFLITVGESRHLLHGNELYRRLKGIPGADEFISYHRNLPGEDRSGSWRATLTNPPGIPVGCFTALLFETFRRGKFRHGYGGVKWAKIAQVLDWFVHGRISPMIMLDTAFHLVHNGGPIFNKGCVYFNARNGELKMVLDAQAAGVLPSTLKGHHGYSTHGDKGKVRTLLRELDRILGSGWEQQASPGTGKVRKEILNGEIETPTAKPSAGGSTIAAPTSTYFFSVPGVMSVPKMNRDGKPKTVEAPF